VPTQLMFYNSYFGLTSLFGPTFFFCNVANKLFASRIIFELASTQALSCLCTHFNMLIGDNSAILLS